MLLSYNFVIFTNKIDSALNKIFENEIYYVMSSDFAIFEIDEKKRCAKEGTRYYRYSIEELLNFGDNLFKINAYKICLFLCENNDYYAMKLFDETNILDIYERYTYKLAINYK